MGRRPFYAEYINHCLRFYCRNTERPSTFKSEVDEDNWQSCEAVLKNYTAEDRSVLIAVYCENDSLADNVYQVSKRFRVNQDKVWNLINEVARKIAKHRGLL